MQHLILLMFSHILADAVFQDRETATKKSESFKVLLRHLFYVSFPVILISTIATGSIVSGIYFTLANAVIHGLIDWNIWKGYKYTVYRRYNGNGAKLAQFKHDKEYAEDPWFYTFIVWDQTLHHVTFVLLCSFAGIL